VIQIKPQIQHGSNCPYCRAPLAPEKVLWQGIHICTVSKCNNCSAEIIGDLAIGQAIFTPFQVDARSGRLFPENGAAASWFGEPFLRSLENPKHGDEIQCEIEKILHCKKVIILNCIDFLYGHSLLKLLNAEIHLEKNREFGLILIIPKFLRWMVPDGVAEIWTVDVPLYMARNYYPKLDQIIQKECERFDEIYVSSAHSHPKNFNITKFSRVQKHDFSQNNFRVTFIWREDRIWVKHHFIFLILCKLKLTSLPLFIQYYKIRKLFRVLRKNIPFAIFTVAGLGKKYSFPEWIDDKRVRCFDNDLERQTCEIYSESRLVIGIHGSNMLLPSAHAGMTLDLMPIDRWGNIAQDILFQEVDNRIAAFRYRYLPIDITIKNLVRIIEEQIKQYEVAIKTFETTENPINSK
jgi:hypothetical protein